MARASSPTEILAKKHPVLQWSAEWVKAFGQPETNGIWFISGITGSGKSSFVMQLVRELATLGKVFYNALEEFNRKTLQDNVRLSDIESVKKNVQFGKESIAELSIRLKKRRAPQFAIIDSVQYAGLTKKAFFKFKEEHPNTLLIFISHVKGKHPLGDTALAIKYDADLKIWTEGFRAISEGRYNVGGFYTIWEEKANKYWGNTELAKTA